MRDTSRTIHRNDLETRGAGSSLVAATGRVLAGMLETLLRWQELSIQRRQLLELDAHMLKDIGISRADALREAGRFFWDDSVGQPDTSAVRDRAALGPVSPCCQE
jgi:uncharacterized protein YjiS (DUF1127 family)